VADPEQAIADTTADLDRAAHAHLARMPDTTRGLLGPLIAGDTADP
jgi:hypothetical protein